MNTDFKSVPRALLESINAKFFEKGDLRGSPKIRGIVFEEERQIVTVHLC